MAGALRGVVALDGPSGTGKTTAARELAATLGAGYLDTGAMYRVVTLAVLRAGVDPADADDGGRSATPEPALADRLPLLPGEPGTDDSTLSVDTGVELGLYPRRSADILDGHGVREVVHRSSTDGEYGYFLLAIPTPGRDDATAVVDRMRELTLSAGFAPASGTPGTLTGPLDGRRVLGTWYASGEVAVNLWVSAPDPADRGELARRTRDALAALHGVLAPT
ncbi:(d)CMP kinase [Saccharomonospora halophila]|uniref:(d)CMP kinase n=1 Tax=Saccharomonospora halophila TaxID=129922 RepID=UPI000361E4A3|nr:(d)CMP kinase [Saccharomonospora halophila]